MSPKVTLSQLRALVGADEWKAMDRTESLMRSIQQSMRVEGYYVSLQGVRDALERSRVGFAAMAAQATCPGDNDF